jgi:hypothetical protein
VAGIAAIQEDGKELRRSDLIGASPFAMTEARTQHVKVVHSDAFVLSQNQNRALLGVPPLRGSIYASLLRVPGPLFQGMIVGVDAFREMGELDEDLIAYQEWDTAIRFARRHAFRFVREPTFVYDCTSNEPSKKR